MRTLQGCHPHGDRAALAVRINAHPTGLPPRGDLAALAVRINAHPTGLSPAWRPCSTGGAH